MTRTQAIAAITTAVWGATLVAALATVAARHESRKLFVELQQLQRERDELDIEWGRLRLEQSTHATHALIETVAREQLRMSVPAPDDIVIVHEP